MASIFDVFGRLLLEGGGRQFIAEAARAGDKAGATVGEKLTTGLKKNLSKGNLGQAFATGLGAGAVLSASSALSSAVGAVADLAQQSIADASSLNETVSKSGVIFGRNAAEMEAWAERGAESFGQSKRAALDTASTFAGLFDTVGFALDDATAKSRKLTELGSDLASFFDTDVATATQALRSGLSGESEPLRRFNVFLSETAVTAKLVELGQKKVNGQWTEGQKVAARYAIIMDQTSAAQGDFARTSDGLANSQREMQAQLENARAELGQELLPAQLAVTRFMADEMIPAFTEFVTLLRVMRGDIPKAADGTTDLGHEVLALVSQYGSASSAMDTWRRKVAEAEAAQEAARVEAARMAGVTAHMADASKDDLREVGGAFSDMGEQATEAASEVRTTAREVLASIQAMREGAVGDAQAAIAAMFDPIETAMELEAKQLELREIRTAMSAKGVTKEELAELSRRRVAVNRELLELEAVHITHGSRQEQINKTSAFLASSFWPQAYKDADPELRAALDTWRLTLEQRLAGMMEDSRSSGEGTVDSYTGELKDGKGEVTEAARTMVGGMPGPLSRAAREARKHGETAGENFAEGIESQAWRVGSAAAKLAARMRMYLRQESPAEAGPLSEGGGTEGWGSTGVELLAEGMLRKVPGVGRAAGKVAGAIAGGLRGGLGDPLGDVRAALVGPRGIVPRPALAAPAWQVPSAHEARILGTGQALAPAPAVVEQHNHVHVEGLVAARDPLEIVRAHDRFARTGIFPTPLPTRPAGA